MSIAIPEVKSEKGELDHAIEPEPPKQMDFECPCGERLVATRKTYDKRAKCSSCGARLLVSLVFNAAENRFEIIPVRVSEPPSGDTGRIPRR